MRWDIDGRHVPHKEWSQFVTAGGLKWHVQITGPQDAPVLLLIHGTGATTHSFAGLAALLSPHFRLVIPDLPGHGFTQKMQAPDPDNVAKALAALLTALNVTPALILGHSVGAAIAFMLAAGGHVQPQAIVSLGGALLPFEGMGKAFPGLAKALFVNPLMPSLFSFTTRFQSMPDLLKRWTGSHSSREQVAYYERLFRNPSHTGGALSLMAHWDLDTIERSIAGIHCPVLLLHGERDKTVPPSTSVTVTHRLAQRGTSAEHHGLPGLGHLAHEEAPDRHAQLVEQFARGVGVLG
ncbi:alpha/beta fold hydrolase BchO [Sandarakinorhabdus sp.]|uniref:alpha/beta fold hydrolase BchO n=1 Tax=Sandarakinorhabdus sp. TaxID=1916663 RepID=UPI00286DBAC8|nr:alpha/beta fold hydrolase BchO [Sandarakinorhabdus sp.]